MSETPGIIVTGASGRMGQMLVETIAASPKAHLHGLIERPGHEWLGRDGGEVLGAAAQGITVVERIEDRLAGAAAIVDFTSPAATVGFARAAASAGVAHVIGTTGLAAGDIDAIAAASAETVIVRAGNMSLGVNLLVELTRQVAATLDEDFDIEIVETHHRHKVDAPSGTALMLGEAAAAGRQISLDASADRGRDGITGARQRGNIGFAAIRGGGVVGEHDVIFASESERITLRHVADDRSLFARGALRAALWAQEQSPGHYSMAQVLGLDRSQS